MTQSIIFTLIGIVLWFVASLLLRRQLEVQRLFQKTASSDATPLEIRFIASQCRRRIQCSVLLVILAVGMIAGSWITNLVVRVSLGGAMFILLGWMILLALFDIIATTTHYRRMSNRYEHEQIRLQAKARKMLHEGENKEEI